MQDYFFAIADALTGLLQRDEVFTCSFRGEESDFVRFNQGHVRQAGHVAQQVISLDLIAGQRHAAASLTLCGQPSEDRARLHTLVDELRGVREQTPADPHLLYATEVNSSDHFYPNTLPSGSAMLKDILAAGRGYDLVGILARGTQMAGFANSFGQRNWSARASFNLDWSLYRHADKAVKARYAGFDWSAQELSAKMTAAAAQLAVLERPVHPLEPGAYRVYLTPTALEEILDLLCWDGFSLHAHRTGVSPLRRMTEENARLHPAITLLENTAEGVAPAFQAAGFIRPETVTLIEQGVYRDSLVSPRSAAEYGVAGNGAGDSEAPASLDLAAGTISSDQILAALDTGLYIGNLWYTNYSDRNAARITGMTRFATFWVEHGRIQAPAPVMRFDDSLYRLLGDRLIGLTEERDWLLDAGSYGGRSTRSARLPGLLAEAMEFTL